MANRIVLNETSYHGKGAVQDIGTEVKKRCFKKALVVTDPDLIKFHVADNVTKLLDANGLAYDCLLYTSFNQQIYPLFRTENAYDDDEYLSLSSRNGGLKA